MFGIRSINKIIGGSGNIQISGNVERIQIGITPEEHLNAIEKRTEEIRNQQIEIRNISESLLKAEANIAKQQIEYLQKQIDNLNEIIRDPQKYLEYVENAQIQLGALLHNLEEKRISGNLEELRREIKAGSFASAERLIEEIGKSSHLNSRLEAEMVSARATLAFLDLRFAEAETLSRRAFYLEPSINTLIGLLDQIEMNGDRGKLLATFNEAKAALSGDLDPYVIVRLLAVEALTNAAAGEFAHAKLVVKTAESAIRKLPAVDSDAEIQLAVCKASMAAAEDNQLAALKHFKAALKILQQNKDEDDLFITRIEANVAACLGELGRLQEAINITKDCVDKLRKAGDGGRYHLGIRLNNLGDFLVRSEREEEALDVLRESIDLAEKNLPARHPSLIRRQLNLALCLKRLGRAGSAIKELKSIQVNEAALNELDRRSLVKASDALFSYCADTERWVDALSAALYIQKIGAEYLGDKATIQALPHAISAIRNAIISGDFSKLKTRKQNIPALLRGRR